MTEQHTRNVGDKAAEQTLALNPLVGINAGELLVAAKSTTYQAIRQPLSAMRTSFGYTRKLVEIAFGKREYSPAPKDRRFSDSAWHNSAIHRGLLQSYLAFAESLDEWVEEADFDELDERRARFITSLIVDAISPTNNLLGNPAALKQAIDTGGRSIVNGIRNFIEDRRYNNGMPSQVDRSGFKVGENIVTTRGSVVFRNEMLELIQYAPTTEKVYRRPLLFIPPQVNKFYFYDLTPDKSFYKFCLDEGLQTFSLSWRNPTAENRDWGIDRYIVSIKDAIDVIKGITGSQTINICATCSGGITASILAAHLKALDDNTIASMTLPVCVLQQEEEDTDLSLFINERSLERARRNSRKEGVLRGRDLARVFSWMRPNDLVWNYVVNNYLMGNKPPAFDILYWNNDSTNLPAQLHSDFLDIIATDALTIPGDVNVCGTDLDLSAVDHDLFLLGGLTDHLTPWNACYRTTRIMGGQKEFLLVGSGHIQSLISSPDNPRNRYFTNPDIPPTPQEWLDGATEVQGTWWPHWSQWIRARSGTQKKAPSRVGSKIHEPLCDAPGTYVHEKAA